MRNRLGLVVSGLFSAFTLVAQSAEAAPPFPTFPPDTSWVALAGPGGPITDAALDGPGGGGGPREIVGPNDPSVYIFSDGTNIFFRIRLDATPVRSPGNYVSFGWGCEINVAPNMTNTYQWLVMMNGTSGQVELEQNTAMTTLDSPGSSATGPNVSFPAWNGTNAGWSRSVAAPTMYNGNPDAFIDFAVPIASLTGVTPTTALRFVCGSSSNTRNLTGDIAGTSASSPTLTGTLSNPYECGMNGCVAQCTGDGAAGGCPNATTPVCQLAGPLVGRCTQCAVGDSALCTGATPVCNAATGTCVACTTDANCGGATPHCDVVSHTCTAACTGDGTAGGCTDPNKPACVAGQCQQCSATNATACTGATPACNATAGVCVQCTATNTAACTGATAVCNAVTNTCQQCTVANSTACTGTAPACNATSGTCVQCTTNAMCTSAAAPVCELNNACGCDLDSQCGNASSGMICNGSPGLCVAGCNLNGNGCPSNQACVVPDGGLTGTCVQSCTTSANCQSPTSICKTTANPPVCVQCLADGDCPTATHACNATSNTCQECTATNTTACTAAGKGAACLSNGNCGCATDSDCGGASSGRICDPNSHMCGAGCRGTGGNGCPSGQTCSSTTSAGGTCSTTMMDGGVDSGAHDSGADTGATDSGAADGSAMADASGIDATTGGDASHGDGGPSNDDGSIEGGGCACSAAHGEDASGVGGTLAIAGIALLLQRRRRTRA